jgi:hypothetical protein
MNQAVVLRAAGGIKLSVESGDEPALIAETILEAPRAPRPRLGYPAGKRVGTMATLRSLLPEAMFDRSLRKRYQLDA